MFSMGQKFKYTLRRQFKLIPPDSAGVAESGL